MNLTKFTTLIVLMGTFFSAFSQSVQTINLKPENFKSYGLKFRNEKYEGKEALVAEQILDSDSDRKYTFAVLNNLDFHNGIIEITLAGQPKKGAVEGARGFVGIAFRIASDTLRYEIIYLRPTNGRSDDQFRRNHTTQYVSHPGFSWRKLRAENPSVYESYVDMESGKWTKVKIEVKDAVAKLYVNGAKEPTLIVNDLKQGKDLKGNIGLWLDIGTLAHFTDLKITKYD